MMREKGLTLIEILVAMGIASTVGILLLVIMVNSAGLSTKESFKVQNGLNINDALSKVRSTIKQASSVAASYTYNSTTYTTSATQLVLKVSSIDSSNNIISDTFDYFVFFLDGKILRFKIFKDSVSFRQSADQIFSTNVSNLTFRYLNSADPPVEVSPTSAAKVQIILTLMQRAGVAVETQIATSEASLRND